MRKNERRKLSNGSPLDRYPEWGYGTLSGLKEAIRLYQKHKRRGRIKTLKQGEMLLAA